MLEARELRVHYRRGPLALDGVSVGVHPGELVAVVGPNGSGKSTLLRALAGLVPLQEGVIYLDKEPLTGLPPHRRVARGLVYAPERARALTGLSVRDNLLIGAWLRRDRKAAAQDLERVLDLFPALRRHQRFPAAALSGGERQMLVLGRALMAAPRILLLDEPLMGVDATVRQRVLEVLEGLREQQVAVLLTEHDLRAVRDVAGRAYGLKGGRVVFEGSAAALEEAPVFAEIYH